MKMPFEDAWFFLKMGFPPSSGPSPMANGNGDSNGGAQEEYSHKDLDAEALIDFLVQTLGMDYQDAKVLVNHHKTKEMAEASQRKARAAAQDAVEGGEPPMPMGGAPL
tara:strand:+ start:1064 stop:1387 length:324 start_codon:yes stop_codon:yes gene_type:complete